MVLCAAPVFADGHEPAAPAVIVTAGAVGVALALAWISARLNSGWIVALAGAALVAAGCVLVANSPRGVITVLVAVVIGAGAGLACPQTPPIRATRVHRAPESGAQCTPVDRGREPGWGWGWVAAGGAGGAGAVALGLEAGGRVGALGAVAAVGLGVAAIAAATAVPRAGREPGTGRRAVAVVAAGGMLAAGLAGWVGANDPTVAWFGHVVDHGDRAVAQVALTFDDGPDDPTTLEVSRILDDHGVKGTFFEVGEAVDARPDITRALAADGHLVGNHSYHHDGWRWLDPQYPELDRTQRAFERALGLCPAFFRPPHGQRTPFMLAHVKRAGMHPVTWDVSAQDWSRTDGAAVARDIVGRARPGSIILLHDGLDGNVNADRSVLRTALPLILDGLRAKGLEPVRLDELLGLPGYLDRC